MKSNIFTRAISVLLVTATVVSFAACGKNNSEENNTIHESSTIAEEVATVTTSPQTTETEIHTETQVSDETTTKAELVNTEFGQLCIKYFNSLIQADSAAFLKITSPYIVAYHKEFGIDKEYAVLAERSLITYVYGEVTSINVSSVTECEPISIEDIKKEYELHNLSTNNVTETKLLKAESKITSDKGTQNVSFFFLFVKESNAWKVFMVRAE